MALCMERPEKFQADGPRELQLRIDRETAVRNNCRPRLSFCTPGRPPRNLLVTSFPKTRRTNLLAIQNNGLAQLAEYSRVLHIENLERDRLVLENLMTRMALASDLDEIALRQDHPVTEDVVDGSAVFETERPAPSFRRYCRPERKPSWKAGSTVNNSPCSAAALIRSLVITPDWAQTSNSSGIDVRDLFVLGKAEDHRPVAGRGWRRRSIPSRLRAVRSQSPFHWPAGPTY